MPACGMKLYYVKDVGNGCDMKFGTPSIMSKTFLRQEVWQYCKLLEMHTYLWHVLHIFSTNQIRNRILFSAILILHVFECKLLFNIIVIDTIFIWF